MPCSHKEVETLLVKLEQSLRQAMLWSDAKPSEKALSSVVPFAFDVMPFAQWLQFIFIPKMFDIICAGKMLPTNLELLPMAEQCFGTADSQPAVIEVVKQIDLVFARF